LAERPRTRKTEACIVELVSDIRVEAQTIASGERLDKIWLSGTAIEVMRGTISV
jgi:hypothetical protein